MPATLELPLVERPARADAVKFHLSLNVARLDRSVAFFQTLFGKGPAKCRPDYAKFELEQPPVVLSLEPYAPAPGGALNHLGFRLGDSTELVEWQRRLEFGGIATQREEGVECCYARQTKFWVRDPDNNLWEFYVLEGDLEHRGAGQTPEELPPPGSPAKAIWQHQLGRALPAKIFAPDNSTDEVQLHGSFNVPHAGRREFLAETHRILQPGGKISLHLLTGDSEQTFTPGTLPGPAAMVTFVPAREPLLADLAAAGFTAVQTTKLSDPPCFTHAGHPLRETMIVARKA